MEYLKKDIIAAMHTGEMKMLREGQCWTDEEKTELITEYFSGMDITTLAYKHQRTESAIMQQLIINHAVKNSSKNRQPYHKKIECQCYRCDKPATPDENRTLTFLFMVTLLPASNFFI